MEKRVKSPVFHPKGDPSTLSPVYNPSPRKAPTFQLSFDDFSEIVRQLRQLVPGKAFYYSDVFNAIRGHLEKEVFNGVKTDVSKAIFSISNELYLRHEADVGGRIISGILSAQDESLKRSREIEMYTARAVAGQAQEKKIEEPDYEKDPELKMETNEGSLSGSETEQQRQGRFRNYQYTSKEMEERYILCSHCAYRTNERRALDCHIASKHGKQAISLQLQEEKIVEEHSEKEPQGKTDEGSLSESEKEQEDSKKSVEEIVDTDEEYLTESETDEQDSEKDPETKLESQEGIPSESETEQQRQWRLRNYQYSLKEMKERCHACSECGYRTNSRSSLERHQASKHGKDVVSLQRKDKIVEHHEKEPKTKTNRLSLSESETEQQRQWRFRNYQYTPKEMEERHLSCSHCGYRTNEKHSLERHIASKHGKEDVALQVQKEKVMEEVSKEDVDEITETDEESLSDSETEKEDSERDPDPKMETNEGYPSESETEQQKQLRLRNYQYTMKEIQERRHSCSECGYRTNSRYKLERHQASKHRKEVASLQRKGNMVEHAEKEPRTKTESDSEIEEQTATTTEKEIKETRASWREFVEKKASNGPFTMVRSYVKEVESDFKEIERDVKVIERKCPFCEYKGVYLEQHMFTMHKSPPIVTTDTKMNQKVDKDIPSFVSGEFRYTLNEIECRKHLCVHCGYRTVSKSSLLRHVVCVHPERKEEEIGALLVTDPDIKLDSTDIQKKTEKEIEIRRIENKRQSEEERLREERLELRKVAALVEKIDAQEAAEKRKGRNKRRSTLQLSSDEEQELVIAKQFTCPIPGCIYTTNSKKGLEAHLKSKHMESNPVTVSSESWTCLYCEKSFQNSEGRLRHHLMSHQKVGRTNEGKIIYKCLFCEMTDLKKSVKQHMLKVHSGWSLDLLDPKNRRPKEEISLKEPLFDALSDLSEKSLVKGSPKMIKVVVKPVERASNIPSTSESLLPTQPSVELLRSDLLSRLRGTRRRLPTKCKPFLFDRATSSGNLKFFSFHEHESLGVLYGVLAKRIDVDPLHPFKKYVGIDYQPISGFHSRRLGFSLDLLYRVPCSIQASPVINNEVVVPTVSGFQGTVSHSQFVGFQRNTKRKWKGDDDLESTKRKRTDDDVSNFKEADGDIGFSVAIPQALTSPFENIAQKVTIVKHSKTEVSNSSGISGVPIVEQRDEFVHHGEVPFLDRKVPFGMTIGDAFNSSFKRPGTPQRVVVKLAEPLDIKQEKPAPIEVVKFADPIDIEEDGPLPPESMVKMSRLSFFVFLAMAIALLTYTVIVV